MPAPLKDDDLTRVAMFLAQQRAQEQGRKVPPSALTRDYGAATVRRAGTLRSALGLDPEFEIESVRVAPGMSREVNTTLQWDGRNQIPIQSLQAAGTPIVSGPVFEGMKEQAAMLSSRGEAPPGKLPFISNTPTHAAPAGYSSQLPSSDDPRMTEAMSQAATAFRKRGAEPAPAPAPAAARSTGASGKRSREMAVNTTTAAGPQPQLRPFQPLAQLAPAEAEQRLAGLPEGVASVMRKRWGLEDAQADANRRALAVELASAANQVGSGIAGGSYNDSLWDSQRSAARQPVADFQARGDEERQQNEAERRAAQDERDAHEAERAARVEMEKFQYGQTRDASQDKLARDRMAQEAKLAEDRMRSEGLDRGLRREEMRLRQKEGAELRQEMANQKRQDMLQRQDEKDLAELAKRSDANSAVKDDLDRIMPYINGKEDVPGIGPVVSALPEFMLSQEGTDVRQSALRLYRNIVRAESGQTVTPQEAASALEAMGMGAGKSEGAWRSGMAALARRAQAALRNTEAGFTPEVVLERARRGGTTSKDIPQATAQPTGEEIDMPDGSVYEVLRDGTTRRIR